MVEIQEQAQRKNREFSLKQKLQGLLEPSTSQDTLDRLRYNIPDGQMTAYLRLRQKPTQQEEWLRNPDTGEVHNGAHFPLLVFTNNPRARSKEGDARRKANWHARSGKWQMNPTAGGQPARLQNGEAAGDDEDDYVLGWMQSPMKVHRACEGFQPAVADGSRGARGRGHISGRWSGRDWASGWSDWGWDSGWRDRDSGWRDRDSGATWIPAGATMIPCQWARR